MQVTDQDTNATLYFEALNYNIAQSADSSTITTALAGLLPAVILPISALNLDEATPTLEQYGVLPVTVTAAAVATCTTDSLPAATYTAVGVALAGASLPPMRLCPILDESAAQQGVLCGLCCGVPLPSAGRADADVSMFLQTSHLVARLRGRPSWVWAWAPSLSQSARHALCHSPLLTQSPCAEQPRVSQMLVTHTLHMHCSPVWQSAGRTADTFADTCVRLAGQYAHLLQRLSSCEGWSIDHTHCAGEQHRRPSQRPVP